jgi:hypothetical protein
MRARRSVRTRGAGLPREAPIGDQGEAILYWRPVFATLGA